MLHVTAFLKPRTPADAEPAALVTGVFDSAEEASAFLSDGDPRADEEVVLPVTWAARAHRRPHGGETLPTTREAAGLVAVVLQ